MNAILGLTLIVTGIIAIAGLVILALTVVGIHREEKRLSLPADAGNPVDALARRVLGAHVSKVRPRRVPVDIWGDGLEGRPGYRPHDRASRYSLR